MCTRHGSRHRHRRCLGACRERREPRLTVLLDANLTVFALVTVEPLAGDAAAGL
jgi:hypothetical protein